MNIDLTDQKNVFHDANVHQLDNIFEEAIENCMQNFHRFEKKCEYKVKFVRGENGEYEAYLLITNRYKTL